MAGVVGKVRRCAVCGRPLPAGSTVWRRYCSAACGMRAYRARRRAVQREMLAAAVISAEAAAWFEQADARRARLTAWARCPGCGVVVWAGVRRRADAVFCSVRCRVRVWRARQSGSGQQDDHNG
ncbi:DUF2116 family Zn-ribbon domain-containing protein [Nonomuraea dietziae]